MFLKQGVHLVVGHWLGEFLADLVEAMQQVDSLAKALLDVATNVFSGIEFGLLWQGAAPDARHDAQKRGLARAIKAKHADFGAGEERQGNIANDVPFRRHDLRHAIHRVNVLSHSGTEY